MAPLRLDLSHWTGHAPGRPKLRGRGWGPQLRGRIKWRVHRQCVRKSCRSGDAPTPYERWSKMSGTAPEQPPSAPLQCRNTELTWTMSPSDAQAALCRRSILPERSPRKSWGCASQLDTPLRDEPNAFARDVGSPARLERPPTETPASAHYKPRENKSPRRTHPTRTPIASPTTVPMISVLK